MTNATIVITRPSGEEDVLTETLHERGYHILHEPLTHVILRHNALSELAMALKDHPDAVIITSRHGVLALATLTPIRDLALICVGETSYNTALATGFNRVSVAGGTVENLLEYIANAYDEESRLLYISAEHVRIDLATALEKQGMQVQRLVLYEAVASEQFSDTFVEHIKRGHVDAVTFLSQRAATIFNQLSIQSGIEESLKTMQAHCMSLTIAQPLAANSWQGVYTAATPTLASLIECIEENI
jgi:uroporphyrinogen-III synthase